MRGAEHRFAPLLAVERGRAVRQTGRFWPSEEGDVRDYATPQLFAAAGAAARRRQLAGATRAFITHAANASRRLTFFSSLLD